MHPKWLAFRHKLFRYRAVEQGLARALGIGRLLDIGCGDGENLLRFDDLPLQRAGVEVSLSRLRKARSLGLDVLQASGDALPFPDNSWDMIYIAHVLHHIANYQFVLHEIGRCLTPGGVVFLVETVSDNPLLRFSRRIRPSWRGDRLEVDWRYAELIKELETAGYEIERTGRYNVLFFLWEMAPLAFWPLEIFTPLFIYLDLFLARFFKGFSAHCYFVLRPNSPAESGAE